MQIQRVAIDTIKPYENNPRLNEDAVEAVMESIRQCGYCAPIVVDENMVILAGHTRHKALVRLGGYNECEVCVVSALTEEKKRKYRLLDNKTGELAKWDFALLDEELKEIDFDGFDFGFTSYAGLDFSGVNDKMLDSEYMEPEKKLLRCPCCNHVDSQERFVKVTDG